MRNRGIAVTVFVSAIFVLLFVAAGFFIGIEHVAKASTYFVFENIIIFSYGLAGVGTIVALIKYFDPVSIGLIICHFVISVGRLYFLNFRTFHRLALALFALCLILICISCYIMFLNIAMQLQKRFYKLVALGLGTCYIFQTFLTIGGVTKFIPSTGVTLPLVSYGGSSVLSTLIMFAIIQGLYILKEEEEEHLERKRQQRQAWEAEESRNRRHIAKSRTGQTEKETSRVRKTQSPRRGREKENRKSRIR